jgi:hypothetical protein
VLGKGNTSLVVFGFSIWVLLLYSYHLTTSWGHVGFHLQASFWRDHAKIAWKVLSSQGFRGGGWVVSQMCSKLPLWRPPHLLSCSKLSALNVIYSFLKIYSSQCYRT